MANVHAILSLLMIMIKISTKRRVSILISCFIAPAGRLLINPPATETRTPNDWGLRFEPD